MLPQASGRWGEAEETQRREHSRSPAVPRGATRPSPILPEDPEGRAGVPLWWVLRTGALTATHASGPAIEGTDTEADIPQTPRAGFRVWRRSHQARTPAEREHPRAATTLGGPDPPGAGRTRCSAPLSG